jgi:creatine kinase
MEIIVTEVDELPANTYLSVRYGDHRRQVPFRKGQKCSFPAAAEKAYTIDVFRKVGAGQVSLAGIAALGGTVVSENMEIPSLEIDGSPLTVSLAASMAQGNAKGESVSFKQEVAQRAKSYLDKHRVQPVLHDMFARLLERLPSDPLSFMIGFLEDQKQELDEQEAPQRDYSQEKGMGDEAYPGFDVLASVLPPLQSHHTLVADILRSDLQMYPNLKNIRTNLGVSFAQCIKAGIDCPGHEFVKVAGVYAGDEQCYESYCDVFDPVIRALHSGYPREGYHPTDTSAAKLTNDQIDSTGRYAVFATLETRRNFNGLRLPTCCSKDERREVERIVTSALISLDGDLKGGYYPLRASESYIPKMGGMSPHQEEQLRRACILFTEPDSKLRLSAGFGRHWPDGRGIFVNEAQSFYLWCNEEDHVRFCARQHNVDLKTMWARVMGAVQKLEKHVVQEGYSFMHSRHLGYLTTCPSRLGTTLRLSVSLKIPLLAQSVELSSLCRSFQLHSTQEVGSVTYGSVWNISNTDCLGVSEVDVINCVIEGCRALVLMEQRLEQGKPIYNLISGMGDAPYFGFPAAGDCPRTLPDLSEHCSLVAQVLRESPSVYESLRKVRTAQHGIGLASCIKPGMDERDSASEPFPGLAPGDAECFEKFASVFDPVIKGVHIGWSGTSAHPVDTSVKKLSNATIDPIGTYAVSVRIEVHRNLAGFKLATCCDQAERCEVERLLVKGLLAMGAPFVGDYKPLAWSTSYVPKQGMSLEEQSSLRDEGMLFPEPMQPLQLSMGLGRHWPEARGLFVGSSGDFYAWLNQEDHLCFTVKSKAADLKGAYVRMGEALKSLEGQLSLQGIDFMKQSRLGYLTVDPANLGNGMKCFISLKLPNLGRHLAFSVLCEKMALGATWHEGAWELASLPSLGISEVDLVSSMIEGCTRLVELDQKLSSAVSIDTDLKELGILTT